MNILEYSMEKKQIDHVQKKPHPNYKWYKMNGWNYC